MNQQQQQLSPQSVGINLGMNALSFLGKVGLRRYQMNTLTQASGLVSKDTSAITSNELAKESTSEIDNAIQDVQNLYGITGDPSSLSLVQELENKKKIISGYRFNDQGKIINEYGNEEDIYQIKNEIDNISKDLIPNTVESFASSVTPFLRSALKNQKDVAKNRLYDLYNKISASYDEEKATNILSKAISEYSAENEFSEYQAKKLEQAKNYILQNRDAKNNIKFINSKIKGYNGLSNKEKYDINIKMNALSKALNPNSGIILSPQNYNELNKLKRRYEYERNSNKDNI
jgi:hypothetical protein